MIPLAALAFLYVEQAMPNNLGNIRPLFFLCDCDFRRECFGMSMKVADPERPANLNREHITVRQHTQEVIDKECANEEAEGVRIVAFAKRPCKVPVLSFIN